MTDDKRLERIENNLDEVRQAVIVLARIEERMVTLFKRMDTYDAAQSAISSKIHALERSVGNNGQMLRFAERVFWIVITAAVAFAFTQMRT
jgi:sorbitol-specific phosphotransferase system component IIA